MHPADPDSNVVHLRSDEDLPIPIPPGEEPPPPIEEPPDKPVIGPDGSGARTRAARAQKVVSYRTS